MGKELFDNFKLFLEPTFDTHPLVLKNGVLKTFLWKGMSLGTVVYIDLFCPHFCSFLYYGVY